MKQYRRCTEDTTGSTILAQTDDKKVFGKPSKAGSLLVFEEGELDGRMQEAVLNIRNVVEVPNTYIGNFVIAMDVYCDRSLLIRTIREVIKTWKR